jgi:hypothetical protein
MKRFSILAQALMIALIVSACGAKATPTANPVDINSTMAAGALTSIAETRTAVPTATPSPIPTETYTPLPTLTFIPVEATITPVPGGNPGNNDPCINQVMPARLEGATIKIRIDNPTKAAIMVSVYLQNGGPQAQCGYRSYSLAAGESLVINDLVVGCYSIWAWNPDPKEYFMVTNGTSCLNTSQSWVFDISTNGIKLRS